MSVRKYLTAIKYQRIIIFINYSLLRFNIFEIDQAFTQLFKIFNNHKQALLL